MAFLQATFTGPKDKLVVNGQPFTYLFRDKTKETEILSAQEGRVALPVYDLTQSDKIIRKSEFSTREYAELYLNTPAPRAFYNGGDAGVAAEFEYMKLHGIVRSIEVVD